MSTKSIQFAKMLGHALAQSRYAVKHVGRRQHGWEHKYVARPQHILEFPPIYGTELDRSASALLRSDLMRAVVNNRNVGVTGWR